jgi:hypothetical protein
MRGMPRASRSRSSKRSSSAVGGILSEDVGTDHALLDLATNDVVNQTVRAQHLLFTARGVQRYPVLSRFAYRSELDLMARPSGMPLPAIRRMGPRPVHSGESGSHLRLRTPANRRVRIAQNHFKTSNDRQTHSQIVNAILREADRLVTLAVDSGSASYSSPRRRAPLISAIRPGFSCVLKFSSAVIKNSLR